MKELQTYTINPGKHYSNNNFNTLMPLTNGIHGKFVLGVGAMPTIQHGHINRIVGLSIGSNHHVNSLSIGWKYSNYRFHIYAYVLYEGEVHTKLITSKAIGAEQEYFIAVIEGVPTIHVDDLIVKFDFNYDHNVKTGTLLFPYYGGMPTAPCVIKFQLSINT